MLEIIDPIVFYSKRNTFPPPKHFIKTNAVVTTESMLWVNSNLRGRYALLDEISSESDKDMPVLMNYIFKKIISFEDPHEALLYELMWA